MVVRLGCGDQKWFAAFGVLNERTALLLLSGQCAYTHTHFSIEFQETSDLRSTMDPLYNTPPPAGCKVPKLLKSLRDAQVQLDHS